MGELENSRQGGAGGVEINVSLMAERLRTFFREWEEGKAGVWNGAHAVAVVSPKTTDDLRYLKSSSLQVWLLGYEFPDTLMVFLENRKLHVVCSQKKAGLLAALPQVVKEKAKVEVVVHARGRGDDGGADMKAILSAGKRELKKAGFLVGVLPKETAEGGMKEKWQQVLKESGSSTVDVSPALAALFAVKDDVEAGNVKKAAFLCVSVLNKFVVPTLESAIDMDEKVTHAELTEKTEQRILEPSKIGVDLIAENVDIAYPPIFQSGGKFDLKQGAQSDDELLVYDVGGVIICALGARYISYCSNVARTYLIDCDEGQEKAYKVLVMAQEAAIGALKPGSPMSAAYDAASVVVRSEAPELVASMTKTAGASMGIELRESGSSLNARNAHPVQAGMVFNVSLGFENLTAVARDNSKAQKFSFLVADTVIVDPTKGPQVLTKACCKEFRDIAYLCNQPQRTVQQSVGRVVNDNNIDTRKHKAALRSEDEEVTKEERRKVHQQQLALQKNEEIAMRLSARGQSSSGARGSPKTAGDIEAYQDVKDIPVTRELMIQVDQKNEAFLLPIYGMMVPFHISTLKSVASQQDGHPFIRFIFNVPGAGFSGNDVAVQKFQHSMYVKEMSFRSTDNKHCMQVVQVIKAMRRQVMQRQSEKADRATLVTQEKLSVGGFRRPVRLPDLWIRPGFGGKSRKATGTLEAHSNGFRYATHKHGERLDIMYRNIKHAFFQPAEKEMITLVHFHLHNPIMVGTKKTKDVQFFVEVMGAAQSLGQGRRGGYDPDEIEEEHKERERKSRINQEFQLFARKMSEVWEVSPWKELSLEFDVPFRALGFHGVPNKSAAFICPTTYCLVELIEMPFVVVTLSEVEIVDLERVGLGQKAFDMAFVFKDLRRDVLRIDAIPSTSLDSIKEWLNSMNIKYYESRMNLNWRMILKTILDDQEKFIADGGWEFLNMEGSDSDSGQSSESEGYEPSDSDDTVSSDCSGGSDDESGVESDEEEEEDEEEDEGTSSDSEDERRRRRAKAEGKARAPESSSGVPPKRRKP